MLSAQESLENTLKGLPEVCDRCRSTASHPNTMEVLGGSGRDLKKKQEASCLPPPISHSETFLLSFKQKVHRKSSAQAPEEPVWFAQTGNCFSKEAKGEARRNLRGAKCHAQRAQHLPSLMLQAI